MTNLTKFPFKAMNSIIKFLHSKGSDSISGVYDIQDASGACFSDTTEILEMLAYLTAFGQVQETDEGWIILARQELPDKILFRERYLTEIVSVLSNLTTKPIRIDILTQNIADIDKKEISELLHFAQEISEFGYVKKMSNGWKLNKYGPLKAIQV